MGAHIRLRERAIERQLAVSATKGVSAPAEPHWGVPGGSDETELADRRAALPPLGLREYWYPLCPDRRVPSRKPLFWKMLGTELVLFRGVDGSVRAITDICPHRGASMAKGKCFYKGTIACPYHGAVFNGDGDCVAFITEGPDSKMVGNLHARSFPTITLKGWVFIWMGAGEPAPMQEDIPPEFFEPKTTYVLSTYTYWSASWIVAIENNFDSHNAGLYVHRNSLFQLKSRSWGKNLGRVRTPVGPRSRLVKDATLFSLQQNQDYYADDKGYIPFQMDYPGVGKWPKTRFRKWIASVFIPWQNLGVNNPIRTRRFARFIAELPEEWKTGGWHMPGMVRLTFPSFSIYNRWSVPVEADLSRIVYFHTRRANYALSRALLFLWFHLYYNWMTSYNFSGQDNRVASPSRYWTPENLSASDSHLILLRRFITERTRDAKRGVLKPFTGSTHAEDLSFRLTETFGKVAEDSLYKVEATEAQSGTEHD